MRGKLIGHRIKYWRKDLNETTESQYLLSRSEKPRALIIGLQPNAYYWVRTRQFKLHIIIFTKTIKFNDTLFFIFQ